MDESSVTGESDLIQKCTIAEIMEGSNKTVENNPTFPILISGSLINEGTAYAIVLTVGHNTYLRQQTKLEENEDSPLQEKLAEIAEQIGNFGMIAAGLTVIAIWGKIF